MELHSNPAGNEANEVTLINLGAFPRGLLRETGSSERDSSEDGVLWLGRACGNVGAGRTGLVQQTSRLRGNS